MVKKISIMMIFILALSFACAENMTNDTVEDLEETYDFNYLAEGVELTRLSKTDTIDMTIMIYSLGYEPGNYEVSAVLGTVPYETSFYMEDEEAEFTLEFSKVFSGEKEFLLMVYKDDSLVAFLTNETVEVDNGVSLLASVDSLLVNDGQMYVILDMDTTLNTDHAVLKITNSKGSIYESESLEDLGDGKVSFKFYPKENGDYYFYTLEVDGFVKEYDGFLGNYDFDIIKNFDDVQNEEGLLITFESACECEKDISVFTTELELLYQETTSGTDITVPSATIYKSGLNGPYKVIVDVEDKYFEYLTSEYTYGDFEVETEEETIYVGDDEAEDESSGSVIVDSEDVEAEEEEEVTSDENSEDTIISDEEIEIVEEEESDEPSIIDTTKEKTGNLLTGFATKLPSFNDSKKTLSIAAIIIALLLVVFFFYTKQKRDSYLYDM
ncbi:hypothetical protein C0585_02790 [Candidatus Woesearchaeota archaeon]|nr:MAG: hypothetical protein C0585_02790 [Candidatus Woesearchaeota archaeon]